MAKKDSVGLPIEVIRDPLLNHKKKMFSGFDLDEVADHGPNFSVTEVSKVFFARTATWLRWSESQGYTLLNGVPVADRRLANGGEKPGYRVYSLAEVELMAYALAENMAIDLERLRTALYIVRFMAIQYGYSIN